MTNLIVGTYATGQRHTPPIAIASTHPIGTYATGMGAPRQP